MHCSSAVGEQTWPASEPIHDITVMQCGRRMEKNISEKEKHQEQKEQKQELILFY